MRIQTFKLERQFALYKAKAKYMLSQTSCEGCSMREILDMADAECRQMWDNLSLGYTKPEGFLPLREAISARYSSIRPSDILELAPEEGIFIFMNNMLEPGDEVIVMHPTLPSLYELPRALGCTVIKWPLEVTSWGWRLDVNFLMENISPKTKLIIMNIPNNPTGFIPVRAELDRILNIADRNGTWIFNEETYRGMEHDPGAALPSLADIYPRATVVGGLNKYNGGATAFPRLLPPYDVTEMCERAMAEKQLLIIGERAFGLDTNHFRVGLGRLDFKESLAVFSELAEEIQNEATGKN